MVEFALIAPLLVSLFLGVVFYGYDFYTYNRLEEIVRAGSRFASIQDYDVFDSLDPAPCSSGSTVCTVALDASSAFAQLVANYTIYGDPNPAAGASPVVEGLTTGNIAVSVDFLNSAPIAVRVGIQNYKMRTPTGTVTLSKPVTVFPFCGNFMPKA
jgi:Flp pilus assembly protein TadG